jgi:hypothetical protein
MSSAKRWLQRRHQQGQIVVEYVLLLVLSVSIAILIISSMVSRNPENPGFLISSWAKLLQTIGADSAEAPNQASK